MKCGVVKPVMRRRNKRQGAPVLKKEQEPKKEGNITKTDMFLLVSALIFLSCSLLALYSVYSYVLRDSEDLGPRIIDDVKQHLMDPVRYGMQDVLTRLYSVIENEDVRGLVVQAIESKHFIEWLGKHVRMLAMTCGNSYWTIMESVDFIANYSRVQPLTVCLADTTAEALLRCSDITGVRERLFEFINEIIQDGNCSESFVTELVRGSQSESSVRASLEYFVQAREQQLVASQDQVCIFADKAAEYVGQSEEISGLFCNLSRRIECPAWQDRGIDSLCVNE